MDDELPQGKALAALQEQIDMIRKGCRLGSCRTLSVTAGWSALRRETCSSPIT